MNHELYSASLEQLELRMRELDEWAQAQHDNDPNLSQMERRIFGGQLDLDDEWNDYHRVRSAYDLLAAQEFDLGQ